jgi:3-deoxy-D-manno-octulosonate 8-phosphate phosphatase (KDO 8-P phosphatase)
LAEIRAIVFDVDGVFTDGGVWIGPTGEEWKRLSFADIMGISRARRAGFLLGLISGEGGELVDRLSEKLGIKDVQSNCKRKGDALRSFSERNGVPLDEICFMGDDVNDVPALEIAGMTAAPADAQPCVLERASVVTKRGGGNGAVREVVELLLAARDTEQNTQS